MTFKNIHVEDREFGVRIVKINRPDVLNALNTETLTELRIALRQASDAISVRAVILTGEGEKAFIAGADIAEMRDKSISEGVGFAKLGHEVTKLLGSMPKPTIAAVNGFALGGGTEMAIACDFIIASENAVFGQPEVALGIIPGFGGTVRLSHFVGLPRAREMIFTGRRVKAPEALQIGLVNHVFPLKDLISEAIKIAETMSKHSLPAIAIAKRLMNEFSETNGLDYKLDSESHDFGNLFGTHDQREGMGAFIEKRKAAFTGL